MKRGTRELEHAPAPAGADARRAALVPARKRALGELVLVGGGKLFGLASLLLGQMLVARSVGRAEYGVYATALMLVLLLDALIGSPLDLAAVRFGALHADEHERVDRLWSAAFRIKLGIGAALIALALVARAPVCALLFESQARTGVLFAALGATLALLLMRGTAAFLQSSARFSTYSRLDALQGLLRLAALGAFLVIGWRSADALLATHGLGTALVFAIALWWIPQRYLRARWPAPGDARAIVMYLGATSLLIVLGTITGRSDVLILASVRTSAETGLYAAALQLATIPTMIASYASIVVQPHVIALARERRLSQLIRWNVLAAAVLCLLASPLIIWLLPAIVTATFGAGFADATPIVRVLLIGTCADMFLMPVVMIFGIQLFPRTVLLGELVITSIYLLTAFVSARAGAIELAWTMTAVRIAKLAWYGWVASRKMPRVAATAASSQPADQAP